MIPSQKSGKRFLECHPNTKWKCCKSFKNSLGQRRTGKNEGLDRRARCELEFGLTLFIARFSQWGLGLTEGVASSWCTWVLGWFLTASSTGAQVQNFWESIKSPQWSPPPIFRIYILYMGGLVKTLWCLLLCPEFKQRWISTYIWKSRRLHTANNLGQLVWEENTNAPARQSPLHRQRIDPVYNQFRFHGLVLVLGFGLFLGHRDKELNTSMNFPAQIIYHKGIY